MTEVPQVASPMTMDDLEVVITKPGLLPPGLEVQAMGAREFKIRAPGMPDWIRISTNPAYYEQHADAMELWSPGNPTFPDLNVAPSAPSVGRLADILGNI